MMMESPKLILLLIVVGFKFIVLLTHFLASGVTHGVIMGWICLMFFYYMPILLSVALTLSVVIWFFYGLLLGDFNIVIRPRIKNFQNLKIRISLCCKVENFVVC
uniref:Uncharacterized protein n=1 Tax=Lactuca sativa TaxID=4236 RepID=A0A9R1VT87_LACSA|nr:hypothetical protein LSAT_V11C400189840 [Lactuca sativa]